MAATRPVIARAEDGTEIYYPSVTDGANAVSVKPGSITRACVTDCWCKKFKWRYADESVH